MEIYNRYIKIPFGGVYESEICFVESFRDFEKNFLNRDEYWVQFKNEYDKLTGFYQFDIPVTNFFGKTKEDFLKRYEDKISNIECSHRHYAYIKVINDKNNPQLNGQTMLFKYGRRIHDKLNVNKDTTFSRTFLLNISLVSGFQNYDKCHFSDTNYYIRDINLNINNIPSLRRLDIIKDIERRFKLEMILKKQMDIKMRKFVCSPFGEEVDLDNPETYSYLPNDAKLLDEMMFKEIGQALVYMDYFHPQWFTDGKDGGQRKQVMERIKYFADYRKEHYDDVMWLKEQVFLFQDLTENMC